MALVFQLLRRIVKRFETLGRLVRLVRFWSSPQSRAISNFERLGQPNLLQPSGYTEPDRYPRIFSVMSLALRNVPAPKVLSYGCSVGDEIIALSRYIPNAHITGVDILPWNIDKSKKRTRSLQNIELYVADWPDKFPNDYFDAIFCMAVLRHQAITAAVPFCCIDILSFEQFARFVTELARCVRVGGYLIIWNSQFRFRDTEVFSQFEVVYGEPNFSLQNSPVYDVHSNLLIGQRYGEAIFRRTR